MKKIKFPKWLKWLSTLLGIILLAIVLWLSHTYQAESDAQHYLTQSSVTTLANGDIQLTPDKPNQSGLIFYPGAQVDPVAYLPLLEPLRQQGVTIIIVKMPLNLAVLDGNAALRYINSANHSNIANWFIGGHSMGGAMASQFASEHTDLVHGLILLGAYPYKNYPANKTLIVYGDLNTSVAKKVQQSENVHVLTGGNHAQFGAYGKQFGDAEATLSAEQQRQQTADLIIAFMQSY